METLKYKDFGVDIDSGNDFVKILKPLVQNTFNPNVLGGLGGFSGCFEIPKGYKNPILCAATDGVGSKLSLAIEYNKLESIGIDLVAMCVNDLICDFAKPMFFLDYYATHKLIHTDAIKVLNGIVQGCKMADCALIGGETAEMPSIYQKGDFDLAGFAVGIAEKSDILKRQNIQSGDIILGFASSGFHSNGFSLLRGIIQKKSINMLQKIGGQTLIDLILNPTKIYVKDFLQHKTKINALAHITGGGIQENLIRILPENMCAIIDSASIQTPDFFNIFLPYVQQDEAFRVFNMGIGMVIITPKEYVDSILQNSITDKSQPYIIGHIEEGKKEVIIKR
ncbi:phosphoribosylformylglycinamidine cyclo-ligase [Helicobacter didelphidarum]|uniref:Phosphoribosylformylglycinamidine cyclo-ligase n=1 Tax=Helicobacter didelphidarum TaxID=2040648 RepID=A0A3D8IPW6_9HELI|nr:phosphoribosylformylglycinamidine cyclo-ligase [Helicobacter didelphidarum]RDU66965.1 phosphoribosylformylglycinamidine cyclo-ligase [Helicobacter didelphidarum]